ncbi:MAG: Yip1 family protein [Roseinatronobacter sp.]
MDLNLGTVSALVRLSLSRPRDAATRLMGLNVPDDARWLGFVIVVLLSVILSHASFTLMGEEAYGGSLLGVAVMQSTILLATVVAVKGVGRFFGGKGTFPDTLLLMAWLQFVMLVFQLIQMASIVLMPPLFGLVAIVSLVAFMWMLTQFIMALHGFQSAAKVVMGIIFTIFALSFLFAVVLALFGLAPGMS